MRGRYLLVFSIVHFFSLNMLKVCLLVLFILTLASEAKMRGTHLSEINAQRRKTKRKKSQIKVSEEDSLAVHIDVNPHIGIRDNDSSQTNSANGDPRLLKCLGWCHPKAQGLARRREWSTRKAMCRWRACSGCHFRFCPDQQMIITGRKYKCTIVEDESLGLTYQKYDSVHAELDCSCCRTGDTKSCCVPFQD